MEYRQVGKWGVRVSEVSLGSWLTYGGGVEDKDSIEQVQYAYDKGINFFDTANVYAHGYAEEIVGQALNKIRRDSFVLASKVYFPMGRGPNDKGLSRKHIFEQCHLSLKRLKMDYIDIYQCHRYDTSVEPYEVVRTMDDLARQGKILYWGVSEWSAEQIEAAVSVANDINALPPISNQPQYNMLHRHIEDKVMPVSKNLGIGQVVFCPLAQGVLTGKYKPGDPHPPDSRALNDDMNAFMGNWLTKTNLETVQRLVPIAQELNLTMAQLALAWILRQPEISSVIIGATKKAQIDDNIGASGKHIPNDVLARIEEILKSVVHA
jgi:aryl-alcohol dehydrogenase-like predicted oxidoreductase